MAAGFSFWRRHRWTALRSLLLVALLHRLHFLAFLAASSPVWLLTAFLLGAVLVNSEPNVPLAAALLSEDEDRHLYKKIRRHLTLTGRGSSSDGESSVTSTEDRLVVDKEEVVKAAVAWTADDEHSIQSIGSLELERDARLEKLMSRRTTQRNLIDLDVPADLHHHSPPTSTRLDDAAAAMDDAPGSAPSSSLLVQRTNPFDIDIDIHHHHQREKDSDPDEECTEDDKEAAILMRHGSFTAGPSRFKPYFGCDNSNSSSPSSSRASDRQTEQTTVRVEEAPAVSTSTWDAKGNGTTVMAVDVELISDSSDDDDDDMSLHGGDGSLINDARDHSEDDEEDSFEVESITQQVAAGKPPRVTAVVEAMSPPSEQGHRHQQQHEDDDKKDASVISGTDEATLPSVEENQQRERDLTEIREQGNVPIIDSPSTSASAGARVGVAGAVVEATSTPPAAAAAAAGPAPPQPAAAPTQQAAAAAPAGPSPVAPPPQQAASAAAAAPTPRASAPPSGKLSSKSKVASKKIDPKKAVLGFFRK